MKALKTALSLIMVICMILSFGTVAFAADSTIPNNEDGETTSVESADIMYTNYGTVTDNSGTILRNGSTDDGSNPGTVVNNNTGGLVSSNGPGSTVSNNSGMVYDNHGTVEKNLSGGEVAQNWDTVTDNNGTVNHNNGTVTNNLSGGTVAQNWNTVTDNNGTVDTNNKDATITTNNGTLTNANEGNIVTNNKDIGVNASTGLIGSTDEDGNPVAGTGNYAKVTANEGTIISNNSTVENNTGLVRQNLENGVVDNREGGVVIDNKGEVYNYGGTVQGGTGTEFFTVDVTATNASSTLGSGFTSHNENDNWLGSNQTASITITPDKGYSIAKPTLDAESGTLDAVGDETSGWTLKFSNLLKNIKLLITGKKVEPKPVAAATNDWSDGYYLFNKAVVKQIKNAEDGGTVTVDATGWASFMRMVFEALAEHPSVTLVVKYGNNRELTVPAGADILSAIGDAQDVLFTKLAKLV